jgi:hypothetical protein
MDYVMKRLPSYHHLDVSATLSPPKMKIKTGKEWVLVSFIIAKMQHLLTLDKMAQKAVKHPFSNCTSS